MRRLAFLPIALGLSLLLTACPQTPPPPINPVECPVGPLTAQSIEEPLRLQGLGRFAGAYVPGELLVVPRPGLSVQTLRSQGAELQEALPRGILRVKVPVGQEKVKAQALLRAGAQYVQPNYLYRPLAVPNDPLYPAQESYLNGLVGLEAAWERSTGRGCPPLIAVLDTGVLPHEDFAASKYLPQGVNLDVAVGDPDPRDDQSPGTDHYGHGLAVASILGADTGNGRGMAGVTWGGYVVPIKVMDSSGDILTAYLVKGLDLARNLGAHVVNLSLGAPGQSDGLLANAVARVREAGAVVVAASGNGGTRGVYFPANLPGVIAVGAVTASKTRANFSSYGPEMSLVAPGVDLRVAGPEPTQYPKGSGTSFASPIVAGVVALYMSKYASERKVWPTPDQVYQCLTATAEDLGPSGRDDEYGFGLVRADRVMADLTHCFP